MGNIGTGVRCRNETIEGPVGWPNSILWVKDIATHGPRRVGYGGCSEAHVALRKPLDILVERYGKDAGVAACHRYSAVFGRTKIEWRERGRDMIFFFFRDVANRLVNLKRVGRKSTYGCK